MQFTLAINSLVAARNSDDQDSADDGRKSRLYGSHFFHRRLSPGDHFVGNAAAEITVLRQVADKVPMADARTEILKAIAVLRRLLSGWPYF